MHCCTEDTIAHLSSLNLLVFIIKTTQRLIYGNDTQFPPHTHTHKHTHTHRQTNQVSYVSNVYNRSQRDPGGVPGGVLDIGDGNGPDGPDYDNGHNRSNNDNGSGSGAPLIISTDQYTNYRNQI